MDPFTIFLILSTLTAVGGQVASGIIGKKAGDAAAKQTLENARYNVDAENQDRQTKAAGEARRNQRRQAMIRAAYAKSGLAMTGTPALMLKEQIKTDRLNMALGDKASGQRNSFTMWRAISNAETYKTQGKTAMWKGGLGAVGSAFRGGMEYTDSAIFTED